MGELASTVTDAMEELENIKADKGEAVKFYIVPVGWNSDSNTMYPKYCDISIIGVTEMDRAHITISPNSFDVAISCGLCPINETLSGKIRVRANSIPSTAIEAEYWIDKGKEGKE